MARVPPAQVAFRPLLPADLQGLGEPLTRCFDGLDEDLGPAVGIELSRIAAAFDPARDFFLGTGAVAVPSGFLIAAHDDTRGGETSVFFWAVDRGARGHGLGKSLLRQAFAEVGKLGLPALRVRTLASTPLAARLLWECGFKVVDLFSAPFMGRRRELILFEQPLATLGQV